MKTPDTTNSIQNLHQEQQLHKTHLKLTRPLCVLDIESATVGKFPDPAVDKIIILAIILIQPNGNQCSQTWRFNPGFPMSAENMAIHGITNAMAATYPLMTLIHAKEIQIFINGCDLGGFNCTGYDLPLLWEECFRTGFELDFTKANVIDAGVIFKKKEERSLPAAVKFYCGREHASAHDAMGDSIETINVLEGQLARYPDLAALDMPALAAFSRHENRIDLFGTIIRNEHGEPVYGTKRNRGVRVADDPGYGEWICRNSFPAHTHKVLREILDAVYNPDNHDHDNLL